MNDKLNGQLAICPENVHNWVVSGKVAHCIICDFVLVFDEAAEAVQREGEMTAHLAEALGKHMEAEALREFSTTPPAPCFDEKCDCIQHTMMGEWNTGKSFMCWGKIELMDVTMHGENHPNDLSHCVYTPGKGLIRYYENMADQQILLRMIPRLLRLLGQTHFNIKWMFSEPVENIDVDDTHIISFPQLRKGKEDE